MKLFTAFTYLIFLQLNTCVQSYIKTKIVYKSSYLQLAKSQLKSLGATRKSNNFTGAVIFIFAYILMFII